MVVELQADRFADESLFQCAGFRIDTTGNCNLRCPYCATDFSGIRGNVLMDPEIFDKVVTLFPLLGPQGELLLSCFFEPTLNPKFLEFVEAVPNSHRHRAGFTTNLAKPLKPEFFERVAESRFGFVNVSIDSLTPTIFMEMRKNSRFEVFKENLEELVRAFQRVESPPDLRFITVVSRLNVAEISGFVTQCADRFHPTRHEIRPIWMNDEIKDRSWVREHSLTAEEFLDLRLQLLDADLSVDISYDLPRTQESFSPFPARLESRYSEFLREVSDPKLARFYIPPVDPILQINSSGRLRFLIAEPEFSVDLQETEDPYAVTRQVLFLQNSNVIRARLLKQQNERAMDLERLSAINLQLERSEIRFKGCDDPPGGFIDEVGSGSPGNFEAGKGYVASGWAASGDRSGPAETVIVVVERRNGKRRAIGIDSPDRERLDIVKHFSSSALLYSGWSARLNLHPIKDELPGRFEVAAYTLDAASGIARKLGGFNQVEFA